MRDCRIGCWLKRKIFVLFWYYLAVTTMMETTATTNTRPARNSDTTGGGGDQGHDGGMPALLMAEAVFATLWTSAMVTMVTEKCRQKYVNSIEFLRAGLRYRNARHATIKR